MSEGSIHYVSQGGIAVITIDRPAKRNALTATMCEQLAAAWQRLRDSDDRVAILAAVGDVFTAGADLNAPPKDFWKAIPQLGVDIGKPVIAAVDGKVIGLGVTLLTFCDLCVATERSQFIYPEARAGVAMGLVSALVARVPHKFAMELMLLGQPITAQRAYEMGFVNSVAPAGAAMEQAQAMAAQLASSAPLVLRLLQKLSRDTLPRSPVETQYAAQLQVGAVMASEDAREGLAAFTEKRAPRFTGR